MQWVTKLKNGQETRAINKKQSGDRKQDDGEEQGDFVVPRVYEEPVVETWISGYSSALSAQPAVAMLTRTTRHVTLRFT